MPETVVKKAKKGKVVNVYRKKVKDENGKFLHWADDSPQEPEPEPEPVD
jgi:hypothetical protein